MTYLAYLHRSPRWAGGGFPKEPSSLSKSKDATEGGQRRLSHWLNSSEKQNADEYQSAVVFGNMRE